MIPKPLLLSLLILSTVFSAPAQSQDKSEQRFYEVEIILFKNLSVPKGSEQVLPNPAPETPHNAIDFFNPNQAALLENSGFELLAKDNLQLTEIHASLNRSSRYQPLLWMAWRQPGLPREQPVPVVIRAGQFFGGNFASIDERKPEQSSADSIAGSEQNPPLNTTGQKGLYELEGLITVSLARYLHTEANLVLRKPVMRGNYYAPSEQDATASEPRGQLLRNYAMKETRRMRSRKLHYLDSPEFGLLVKITPVDVTETEPELPEETIDAEEEPVN